MKSLSVKKTETALVAEGNALNNPHFDKVVAGLKAGYKPHRIGKSNRQIRIDHTAMIPLEKDVWAWKKDPITGKNTEPRLVYRAGWYLSLEDNYVAEQLLADPENAQLNADIQGHLEAQGLPTTKRAGSQREVKVVDGE